MVSAQCLQHLDVGRVAALGLFDHRQLQLVKQDLAQFFGRVDVELLSRLAVDLRRQLRNPSGQRLSERTQGVRVRLKADHLHLSKHGHERKLHVIIQIVHALRFDLGHDILCQLLDDLRMDAQSLRCLFTAAEQRKCIFLLIVPAVRNLPPQIGQRDAVKRVAALCRIEQIGAERRVEHHTRGRNPLAHQRAQQFLAVVQDQRNLTGEQPCQNIMPSRRAERIRTRNLRLGTVQQTDRCG